VHHVNKGLLLEKEEAFRQIDSARMEIAGLQQVLYLRSLWARLSMGLP
jgi:hypothetical protein